MKKMSSAIKGLTQRERKLLVVALLVFVIWIIHLTLGTRLSELSVKKRTLRTAETLLTSEQDYQEASEYLGLLQKSRELLIKRVPEKNPTADFLDQLETWCEEEKLDLLDLEGFEAAEGKIPIKIHLKGELASILNVLDRLGKYSSALYIDDTEFYKSTGADEKSPKASEVFELGISITLYYLEKQG